MGGVRGVGEVGGVSVGWWGECRWEGCGELAGQYSCDVTINHNTQGQVFHFLGYFGHQNCF